jgi:hypothetical protein
MDAATLVWGMVFGSIGVGYFIYGKRQSALVPLVCGLLLMVFPYFFSSAWAIVLVGLVLMAIPRFLRI